MPAIGDRDFPTTNIDTAIEVAKRVATQFKGSPFDRKALAATLQLAVRSGGFNQLVADVKRYGVIQGRGDAMSATEVAQKLALPNSEEEYSRTVVEMLNRIPLFQELYHHYKGIVPSVDDLRVTLVNITKEDRMRVDQFAGRIRANLQKGWSKSGPFMPPAAKPAPSENRPERDISVEPPEGKITLTAGAVRLEYPLTKRGIAMMKLSTAGDGFWALLEEQVKPALSPPPARKDI